MLLSFNNFVDFSNLITEAVNKHSTHIEEKFIIDGKKGLAQTVAGLTYTVKTIGRGIPAVSTKMDGIAVFFGYTSKGFFVGTKSIFNKVPKINYSDADINTNHPDGPGPMLKQALKYLVEVCPKKIGVVYQGDYLFDAKTLKSVKIDDIDCWAWHPNIIEYTVSKSSDLGKKIGAAKFGIVVHTKYFWPDENDNKTLAVTEFGISKFEFKNSKNVFLIDTISNFSSNTAGFTESEYNSLMSDIKGLGSYNIDYSVLTPDFVAVLLPYINTYVKVGNIPSAKEIANNFPAYLEKRIADIDLTKKSDKQRETAKNQYRVFLDTNLSKLEAIMNLFLAITSIKLRILEQLNKFTLYKNFVVTTSGDYIATKDEGFVITKTSAKGVKLVDRLEFSRNNFSKDIVSGFSKPGEK